MTVKEETQNHLIPPLLQLSALLSLRVAQSDAAKSDVGCKHLQEVTRQRVNSSRGFNSCVH